MKVVTLKGDITHCSVRVTGSFTQVSPVTSVTQQSEPILTSNVPLLGKLPECKAAFLACAVHLNPPKLMRPCVSAAVTTCWSVDVVRTMSSKTTSTLAQALAQIGCWKQVSKVKIAKAAFGVLGV